MPELVIITKDIFIKSSGKYYMAGDEAKLNKKEFEAVSKIDACLSANQPKKKEDKVDAKNSIDSSPSSG